MNFFSENISNRAKSALKKTSSRKTSAKKIPCLLIAALAFTFAFSASYCFSQDRIELKNASELSGKVIDGQNVREASGNVEFVQGNVKVYCSSATQYMDANRVELRGNVRIYQDTITLLTSKATYFGDDRKAICEGGVTLKDPNATVRADNGVYFFNESKAIFKGDVIIVNPDYRITSSELTYLRNTEESFARGNVVVNTDSAVIKASSIDFYRREGRSVATGSVMIESDSTVITSDSAVNFSAERKSFASGNVAIRSLSNDAVISGSNLENYGLKNYTILKGDTRLVQIEESKDTLYIYSDTMQAYRTKPEYYTATGNVEVIRTDFLARCGKGVYYRDSGTVAMTQSPVVWQGNIQMTGDSVYAELPEKKLRTIYAKKLNGNNAAESFVISSGEEEFFKDRYDQMSGDEIELHFTDDKISFAEIRKNSNSIYFLYENNKANGLNRMQGNNMFIYFDENKKVKKIRVDAQPKGEYFPESLLHTAELTLPGFNLRDDKPVRK